MFSTVHAHKILLFYLAVHQGVRSSAVSAGSLTVLFRRAFVSYMSEATAAITLQEASLVHTQNNLGRDSDFLLSYEFSVDLWVALNDIG